MQPTIIQNPNTFAAAMVAQGSQFDAEPAILSISNVPKRPRSDSPAISSTYPQWEAGNTSFGRSSDVFPTDSIASLSDSSKTAIFAAITRLVDDFILKRGGVEAEVARCETTITNWTKLQQRGEFPKEFDFKTPVFQFSELVSDLKLPELLSNDIRLMRSTFFNSVLNLKKAELNQLQTQLSEFSSVQLRLKLLSLLDFENNASMSVIRDQMSSYGVSYFAERQLEKKLLSALSVSENKHFAKKGTFKPASASKQQPPPAKKHTPQPPKPTAAPAKADKADTQLFEEFLNWKKSKNDVRPQHTSQGTSRAKSREVKTPERRSPSRTPSRKGRKEATPGPDSAVKAAAGSGK